jgi:CheY-like chemotaxis protein
MPRIQKPRTSSRHGSKKILVVDGEKDIARMIQRQLQRVGYQVVLAHTGDKALNLTLKERPSLITMDIHVHGKNGYEVIQTLKEDSLTKGIPIVVVSVGVDEEKISKLDVDATLDKPIDEDVFLRTVERVLWRGKRILVYVSDAETRQLIEDVLPRMGYYLVLAQDGVDLLVEARREQPDLILMDLQLSDMDGYEVLRRLNRRPETVDIPVIAMTDNPAETVSKVLAVGGNDLVLKPLDLDALAVEIERFLGDVREKNKKLT